MAKVWNITDHPGTDCPTRVMMVLGRSVRPGKCINVPDDRLVNAHKVNRAVKAQKLFIGPRPPADYLLAKKRGMKAELAIGVARAHGPAAAASDPTQVTAAELAKLTGEAEAAAGRAMGLKDEVSVELKSSEPVEPTTKTEDASASKKKDKKRGG